MAIAVAAYSYMALVPIIQPPIMRLLTTEGERQIAMKQLRPVSRRERIVFPIMVFCVCAMLLPEASGRSIAQTQKTMMGKTMRSRRETGRSCFIAI